MDVKRAKRAMDALMRQHGLPEAGWTVRFTTALQNKAGVCDYLNKRITINSVYIWTNDAVYARDTMLHEIAHALVPYGGHGAEWVAMAQSIGCTAQRFVPKDANWLGRVAQVPAPPTECTSALTKETNEDNA